MKSEPGKTGAGDWGGAPVPLPQSPALPPQSPRLPRLFSSFPPSESLEQATLELKRNELTFGDVKQARECIGVALGLSLWVPFPAVYDSSR